MKIKVCGITSFEQMQQLQEIGINYAGMIFYENSKRFVKKKLNNQKLKIRDLAIKKVGVFVNADFALITKAIDEYDLYAVQLHGDETDEFCMELMDKTKVIKVFRIADQADIDTLIGTFQNACDYFLFDTDTAMYGGSGHKFDWKILEKAKIYKPFFLSGGIGVDDIEKIKNFLHPYLYAADINSRFETAPGVKDLVAVKKFISGLNHEESDTRDDK